MAGGERGSVDEQGFDFRQPKGRREPKQFEPPPWEKQAFEELERKRREDEARREEEAGRGAEEQQGSEAQLVAEPPAEAAEQDRPAAVGVAGETPEETAGGIEERVVIEMLAELAAQEPKPAQQYPRIAIVVGIATAVLGMVLLVWAMAALVGAARTGTVGYVGGAGLGFFGVFFMAMGAWMVYRALKQRGVL